MNCWDLAAYNEAWDYDKLSRYGASRRVLGELRWDMPFEDYRIAAEILAQFDCNNRDEYLHSQYGEIRADFYPAGFALSGGFVVEAIEDQRGDRYGALGILGRAKTRLPGPFDHGLTVTGKFSSGSWNRTFTAFIPVNYPSEGEIYSEALSSLALVSLAYDTRLSPELYGSAKAAYFFRTADDSAQRGDFLCGPECWLSLTWQPLSDIRANIGGGAFFPGLGNVYETNKTVWKVTAGFFLSL